MTQRVWIVTDSTAYIPQDYLERNPFLRVVPLRVHFSDQVLVDGLNILPQVVQKIGQTDEIPTTSQPPPAEFLQVYQEALAAGCEVVGIFISSELSGTAESARTAAGLVDGNRISVVDSRTTAAGLALLVMEAVEAAEQGCTRQEIVRLLEDRIARVRLMFAPHTLEFLKKGGRIGGAAALVGALLQIKPVLHLKEGRVEVMEKVRTKGKAMQRMIMEVPSHPLGEKVALIHVIEEENMEELKALLLARHPHLKTETWAVGPVIAAHVGPGVYGLAFFTP